MIEYFATAFSVCSRLVFVYLIIANKSKNTISLVFSLLSILSGSCWLILFVTTQQVLLTLRTSIELVTSVFSAAYIIRNKMES